MPATEVVSGVVQRFAAQGVRNTGDFNPINRARKIWIPVPLAWGAAEGEELLPNILFAPGRSLEKSSVLRDNGFNRPSERLELTAAVGAVEQRQWQQWPSNRVPLRPSERTSLARGVLQKTSGSFARPVSMELPYFFGCREKEELEE